MNARCIDWIWHIRGSLALPSGQSGGEALDRLDPLFRQAGTTHKRSGDRLTFRKKDQAAQDKMSVFDDGVLRVENGVGGPVLRYTLKSRALLFCFLVPLLFLGIAQLTMAMNRFGKPFSEAAAKSAKAAAAKKDARKDAVTPLNPIDKALGAPAPEKKKKKKDEDESPTPTSAYVFAAIFAALYVVGRILEDRLIKGLFRKRLLQT